MAVGFCQTTAVYLVDYTGEEWWTIRRAIMVNNTGFWSIKYNTMANIWLICCLMLVVNTCGLRGYNDGGWWCMMAVAMANATDNNVADNVVNNVVHMVANGWYCVRMDGWQRIAMGSAGQRSGQSTLGTKNHRGFNRMGFTWFYHVKTPENARNLGCEWHGVKLWYPNITPKRSGRSLLWQPTPAFWTMVEIGNSDQLVRFTMVNMV